MTNKNNLTNKEEFKTCPICGGDVFYNFNIDRWECSACNFSDLFKPETAKEVKK